MARVTIEDCLKVINNRFQLVLLASKRSRDLASGAENPSVAWENDKSTVVALREIEEGHVGMDYLDKTKKPQDEEIEAVETTEASLETEVEQSKEVPPQQAADEEQK